MRAADQPVLLRALSLQGIGPAQAETARAIVLAILLCELLAGAAGRGRAARGAARPPAAPAPTRRPRPARGSLPGRRPRG